MINLLDHGYVRLVDHMGTDLSIVRSARASYNAEWRTGEDEGKDAKLINYLIRNRHTSPFESVVFTFEVKAPIFVFRQWQRHRTWSFNEVSARYSVVPDEYYVPALEQITTQSTDNKQMRTDKVNDNATLIQVLIRNGCDNAFFNYEQLLALGCPRELARGVLPVNTYSRMFATVNLPNFLHFMTLRADKHAQYEIRVYAEAMLSLVRELVPLTIEAYERHILRA